MKKSIILVYLAICINTLVYAQSITVLNPSENIGIDNWNIVNDGVMGGISQSSIYLNEANNIKTVGNVSPEANEGFA